MVSVGGLGFDPSIRCTANSFGLTSVRLFANAITWGSEGLQGFRALNEDNYKLPLPEEPGTSRV